MNLSPAARKAGHDAAASPLSGAALDLTPADLIDLAMDGAAPVIAAEAAAAERRRCFHLAVASTQCPTPCDDDCELRPDGCHETHQPSYKRAHQPHGCEDIRLAIGATAAAERARICALLARFRERMVFAASASDPIPYQVEAVPWARVLEALALAGDGRAEKGDDLAGH